MQAITARTDRTYASGLFRVSSEAAPTGAQTRIGLRAEAGTNDTSHSAGMYLEARSDGTTQAGFIANRFWLATGPAASPQFPFIVNGSRIQMDASVWIKDLSVGTLQMEDGSVTVQWSVKGTQLNISVAYPMRVIILTQGTYEPGPRDEFHNYELRQNTTVIDGFRLQSIDFSYMYTRNISAGNHTFQFVAVGATTGGGRPIRDPRFAIFGAYR